MNKSNNTGNSIFVTGLTVLFIGLKLTGHITWSWWWVLSPLWLPFTIILSFVGIVLACRKLFKLYRGRN